MFKRLLRISIILLPLVACSDSTAEQPNIEATGEAKVNQMLATQQPNIATPLPTSEAPSASISKPTATLTPKPTVIPTPTATLEPSPTSVPTPLPTQAVNTDPFWNEHMYPVTQKCTGSFGFTHMLVDVADVGSIGVSPGGHIAPHDHMAYWGTTYIENQPQKSYGEKQSSEKVQLYSPADIFFISLGKNTKEWGGTLFTCDGHGIIIGHVSDPSDELNLIFSENEPEPGCGDNSCKWRFPTFIPAGTPLFKSSGYTSGFDFGLMLAGLTAEELQGQPGYGYSITPWRTGGSGNAVCPLEYFEEPLRSGYMKFLGDFNCGPFNQDVPGTAMGYWLPSPSPETVPLMAHWKGDDEWETIYLFDYFNERSEQGITVGNNTFGLDYNEAHYYFKVVEGGLVNQPWDLVRPGQNYCAELKQGSNTFERNEKVHRIIITALSEDGTKLTIEALDDDTCGNGPWAFQGMERTFYR